MGASRVEAMTIPCGAIMGREGFRGAKSDLKPELGQDFVDQQLVDRELLTNKTDIGAYFAVHKGMSDVNNASAAMALYDGTEASKIFQFIISASKRAIPCYTSDNISKFDGPFAIIGYSIEHFVDP